MNWRYNPRYEFETRSLRRSLAATRRGFAFYVADPSAPFIAMTRALVLGLLTVVASSAVAAGDRPEEVIRALYKAHRPWEHKELNLASRPVLSKYFSRELTKLFLKNAQLERDCPEGDLCGIEFDPILGSQDFDDHLKFKLRITQATPPEAGRFEVHFKLFNNESSEEVVVFQLVSSKTGWLIDDIIYPHLNNTSLKALLTARP